MNALSEPTGLPNAKPQVLPPKSNALEKLFRVGKPIIGVIHLAPLPGAPRYEGQRIHFVSLTIWFEFKIIENNLGKLRNT